jgi:Protein of unknown function (DUF3179)
MRRTFWICFLICFLAAAAFLVYPLYVIRPFRAQQSGELMAALAMIRYRPVVMAFCAAASVGLVLWYWRRERGLFQRISSAVGLVLIAAVVLLSRINIYEKMFHPIGQATFSPADQAKLDGDEKVIAVTVGQVGRAYPIRIVSYHHIVTTY